ncbi:hypothetical protein MCUN1_001098 [Malassezia cuniculi]|uniref:Endoplasmic reticulum membrane protein 65 n=1 Tax=Malassezia cuniculi TaxID=948313 RepID=A0AAF0JAF8_9BASI|nr:hypothetical protein MCUN1_001098 [Malassezia cuniculi]
MRPRSPAATSADDGLDMSTDASYDSDMWEDEDGPLEENWADDEGGTPSDAHRSVRACVREYRRGRKALLRSSARMIAVANGELDERPEIKRPEPKRPEPKRVRPNPVDMVLVLLGLRAPPGYDNASVSAATGFDRADAAPRATRPELSGPKIRSLWDHLLDEVQANSFDSVQELKWERVSNFMTIPLWIEKTMLLGCMICLNCFLYVFTILPLRFVIAWARWAQNSWAWLYTGQKRYLYASNKCDILKGLLIIQTCYIIARVTDASKMYHSVRGQDVVKLSVIFSVLEITDRLLCSFGQDVLDSLLSRHTLSRREDGTQGYVRLVLYYALSLAYMVMHSFVMLYQLVTLNVAINSYNNELLTLLLSNQFVEIKTSVFKRFEKEILFQLTCADIVERFQMAMILTAIALRNLIEVSGASGLSDAGVVGPLPTSFNVFPFFSVVSRTINPVLTVLLSELLVDWLKHAFVTKFNHIRPALYGRFMDVLCYDLLPHKGDPALPKGSFVDQSPIAARRLGFSVLPLSCVMVRLGFQIFSMINENAAEDELELDYASHEPQERAIRIGTWILFAAIGWTLLVMLKILLGVNLVSYASRRYASRHAREHEEQLNAKGRAPIGEVPAEAAQRTQLRSMVDRPEDNASSVGLYGQQPAGQKPKQTSLIDVSRYQMAGGRLW